MGGSAGGKGEVVRLRGTPHAAPQGITTRARLHVRDAPRRANLGVARRGAGPRARAPPGGGVDSLGGASPAAPARSPYCAAVRALIYSRRAPIAGARGNGVDSSRRKILTIAAHFAGSHDSAATSARRSLMRGPFASARVAALARRHPADRRQMRHQPVLHLHRSRPAVHRNPLSCTTADGSSSQEGRSQASRADASAASHRSVRVSSRVGTLVRQDSRNEANGNVNTSRQAPREGRIAVECRATTQARAVNIGDAAYPSRAGSVLSDTHRELARSGRRVAPNTKSRNLNFTDGCRSI